MSVKEKAVIYTRVSSSKQTKVGDGLRSQETRCRDFARMKGYEVVEVFQDDVSGSLVSRPGMKAMLSFIRMHRASDVVAIIDDVSRLARGLEAHLQLRSAIDAAGGRLESPSIEFGEDPDSILVENLLASVSQHQRQKNGEQTKNRMKARVLNGYYCFQAPAGYQYVRSPGRGKVLKRAEPVASIIQEGLEGYASGRFQIQAEVKRFFETFPEFPRDSKGDVRNQRVTEILTKPVYAGYVEAPSWGVDLRKGQHEGLISFATFQKIQERLTGTAKVPARKNLNEDFPLRGFITCGCCGTPLTACWSKGRYRRYPYYLCPTRGCEMYGKSIRREKIEGEFEELLKSLEPTDDLYAIAQKMFAALWEQRLASGEVRSKSLKVEAQKLEKQVEQILDRIVEAESPTVITAYEKRVKALEMRKLEIDDAIANCGRPVRDYDETLRTALDFLGSPHKLWVSDRIEDKRAVLKLTFADRLGYVRNEGFRTAYPTLPFQVIQSLNSSQGGQNMVKNKMAHRGRFELPTPRFVV